MAKHEMHKPFAKSNLILLDIYNQHEAFKENNRAFHFLYVIGCYHFVSSRIHADKKCKKIIGNALFKEGNRHLSNIDLNFLRQFVRRHFMFPVNVA